MVDPAGPKPAVAVTAGHAVTVTLAGAKPIAIAKVAAEATARRVVLKQVASATIPCRLTPKSVSVAATGSSWRVTVRTTKGTARWTVTGSKATPANALARKISTRCA
jgi:hypothetical protein